MKRSIKITIPLRIVGILVLFLLLGSAISPVLLPGIEPYIQVPINPVFASPDTDTFYVGGGNDDSYEFQDYLYTAWDDVEVTRTNEEEWFRHGGFRFQNVAIPKGSTIVSAKFSGYANNPDWDSMYCTIYAHDTGNATNFVDNPNILSTEDRPRTSASVDWHDVDVGAAAWVDKTGLESIVQEIVDRGDWSSGNSIVLLFIVLDVDGVWSCIFNSYNFNPIYAAKLEVTWTPPPPVTVTQTFLSTTTTDGTVCIYTVVQVIIDPITTVTVTSSSYTTTGTTVVTSTATCTTTCETSIHTSLTTTCLSSTVTLLTFCVTSTIPTSCTTSMITSCETSTTTTCSLVTWTETTTWVSTSVGS